MKEEKKEVKSNPSRFGGSKLVIFKPVIEGPTWLDLHQIW